MIRAARHVLVLAILAQVGVSTSLAQSQTPPQSAPKPAEMPTMKMDDVSKWTQKQWNAAKVKWSEEKTKWNDCQTQAKSKSLSGHKSWQFLYDCMTK